MATATITGETMKAIMNGIETMTTDQFIKLIDETISQVVMLGGERQYLGIILSRDVFEKLIRPEVLRTKQKVEKVNGPQEVPFLISDDLPVNTAYVTDITTMDKLELVWPSGNKVIFEEAD